MRMSLVRPLLLPGGGVNLALYAVSAEDCPAGVFAGEVGLVDCAPQRDIDQLTVKKNSAKLSGTLSENLSIADLLVAQFEGDKNQKREWRQ